MPKKDWKTIITTINTKSPTYLKNFLTSNEVFCPSKGFENIFEPSHNAFSSKHLNKPNPANWIPIYKEDDLSDYLIENQLMPVRCGQREFFFYRGEIVFDLRALEHDSVLKNEDEIIIFEAKQGKNLRENFILLQLYYPLIYLSTITKKQKKIRTETPQEQECYRLTEFLLC